jgi:biopolymer transport protein ExbB
MPWEAIMLRRCFAGDLGRLRLLTLLLVPLFVAGGLYLTAPQVAQAQEPEDAGAGAAAPAAPAAPAASGQTQPAPQKSLLRYYYEALGALYTIVFLGISFALVAVVVMNILAARRDSIVPVQLVEGFEAHLNEKRYQEAYEMAKNDESFLGKVLSAGLAKLSAGYPQAMEAMQEVGEEENMKLEHRLSYIALIGTISPMVGLLGTVDGMTGAFQTIAASTTAPKPDVLAGDISKALVTTLFGLWLAIPAILVYGILKNRLSRLVLEVGILSEGLMGRFQSVGKK